MALQQSYLWARYSSLVEARRAKSRLFRASARAQVFGMVTLRIAVLTTVSLALFFGLAILGEGGPVRFFSSAPLVAVIVVNIALGIAALFSQGHIGSGVREDRSNRWVIAAFTFLGLALAYFPALCDRYDVMTFGGDAVRWLGVALGAAGGVVRLAPVFVLGRRFSGLVAIQPNHKLVTDGLYGLIRHPSYLGIVLTGVGWSLVFRGGVGLVITALMFFVLIGRMNAEERLLGDTFGAQYAAYRARTWRLVPYLY
jgi:protein-S-isoprenylcysteine O-methyltransferase Ste14